MFSLAGACVSYAILGFAPDIAWVLASRVLGGLMAGNISAAMAYASDISTPPPDTGPRLNKTEDGNLVADVDPRELGWTPVRIKDRVGAHLDWYCTECKEYAENAQYYEDI